MAKAPFNQQQQLYCSFLKVNAILSTLSSNKGFLATGQILTHLIYITRSTTGCKVLSLPGGKLPGDSQAAKAG